MNNVIAWIKGNPFTIVCGAIVVASLGSFYWPIHTDGAVFRQALAERSQDLNEIQGLMRTGIQIPPPTPDGDPISVQVAVNDRAITELQTAYGRMEQEYKALYDYAVRRNQPGYRPLLNDLFPKPKDDSIAYEARKAYLNMLRAMYTSLKPGTPPSSEKLDVQLAAMEENFKQSAFPPIKELNETQRATLQRSQVKAVMKAYENAARGIHVYADPATVFDIGKWSQPGPLPEITNIWDGQLQVWVLQTLILAIKNSNRETESASSVIDFPIKRILKLGVIKQYVGVPEGGFREQQDQDTSADLKETFAISPTGRSCNPIYDVHHAVVSILIDSKRIPELLNSFVPINFMTVIGFQMTDVNEYDELRQGFYYGDVDVVKVDLTVETLWLRQWTVPMMPFEVQQYLGIEKPDPSKVPAGSDGYPMGPGGYPGGPGAYPGMPSGGYPGGPPGGYESLEFQDGPPPPPPGL